MDVKLDKLIDKIKSEGIQQAEQESGHILQKAKKEADQIIAAAKKEAETIITRAKEEAEKLQISGKSALKQAERDAVLVTKEKLIKVLDSVLKKQVSNELKPGLLADLIQKMVDHAGDDAKLKVLVNQQDIKELEKLLLASTNKALVDTVEIKADRGVSKGFRIGKKGENVYYDFTDDSIAEFLREFLNPSIKNMLSE
ncbi:MAG: hypothetical protein JXQ65_13055 [Candidatus Marinimicrobia bacterium]|nr:hypothetical protein [Candidatus Neomarinimicrobiota bacterium]